MRKTTTHKKHKKIINHTSKKYKIQKRKNTRKCRKNYNKKTRKHKNGGMDFFRRLGLCRPNTDGVIDPICTIDIEKIRNIRKQILDVSNETNIKIEAYKNIVSSLSLDEYNEIIKKWNDTKDNKELFIKSYLLFLSKKNKELSEQRSEIALRTAQFKNKELSNQIKRSNQIGKSIPRLLKKELKTHEEIEKALNKPYLQSTNEELEELKKLEDTEKSNAEHMAELEEMYEKEEELRKGTKI